MAARSRALERYAFVLTGDRQRAEDLVQNALLRVYRQWNRVSALEHRDASVRSARPGEPLLVTGHLENGTAVSHSTVDGGPGPSYVDVPVPGCWVFDLKWGTHRDVIALPYAAG